MTRHRPTWGWVVVACAVLGVMGAVFGIVMAVLNEVR